MDEIKNHLEKLGLSQDGALIYLKVLELGSTTVLTIARKTRIPRTTVYLLIDELISKGILTITLKGKKKYYLPTSPKELLELAKLKKKEITDSITGLEKELFHLQALYNSDHRKPKIMYYDGVEEVKKVYEDTLTSEKIYMHCMSEDVALIMGEYLEKFYDRLSQQMIQTFEIVSDKKEDKNFQKQRSTSRNQIVCIPEKYITKTDYLIYGSKVAFITFKDKTPVAIVIEDSEIAYFETMRYLMIWEKFT